MIDANRKPEPKPEPEFLTLPDQPEGMEFKEMPEVVLPARRIDLEEEEAETPYLIPMLIGVGALLVILIAVWWFKGR
jgi:hypothetical protein